MFHQSAGFDGNHADRDLSQDGGAKGGDAYRRQQGYVATSITSRTSTANNAIPAVVTNTFSTGNAALGCTLRALADEGCRCPAVVFSAQPANTVP